MSWEDVLKVLTPRMFLENIQNIVGEKLEVPVVKVETDILWIPKEER